jgi:pimeloyl-ACP methyl ester carboxylesterase
MRPPRALSGLRALRSRWFGSLLLGLGFLCLCVTARAATVAPPSSGYGSPGPYAVDVERFASPLFLGRQVSVYMPTGLTEPAPTIFFAHGYGGDLPAIYDSLLGNLASQGYGVVFSPFNSAALTETTRYAQMFSGFSAAIDRFSSELDSTRVGFIGHSYGGGALPALAWEGLVEEGWGSNGSFMYSLAPWYSYGISQEQLEQFPDTNMVMQIFDDDRVNDHRMAIDIYRNINIPESDKAFLTVYSDERDGTLLEADHFAANGGPLVPEVDAIDDYGIFKTAHALADYAFTGNLAAQAVALGEGTDEQTYMGTWSDGTEVRRMSVTDNPRPQYRQIEFLFPALSLQNPRAFVPEPGTWGLLAMGGLLTLASGLRRQKRIG